jgi:S-methylmethionine-dependent homocysteine/selenocysteine methylase
MFHSSKSVPLEALFVFNDAMIFENILRSHPLILMEAAVIERLRRAQPALLHPRLVIAPLVQTLEGREALTVLYREYIGLAKDAGLPIILSTPTWRASRNRCTDEDLNADAVQFMQGFKQEYSNLFIAGQMGCKNDCYKPEEALAPDEAFDFHSWQTERLSKADFLYGVTLPEVGEALGMARAMAATDRPYIISFVIGKDGRILDGTPLEQAIDKIDFETERPPLGYGVNCCYPAFLQTSELSDRAAARMVSIQANASSLTHAELDAADTIQANPIKDWSNGMLELHRTLGVKILGGCCGTTDRHLRSLTNC